MENQATQATRATQATNQTLKQQKISTSDEKTRTRTRSRHAREQLMRPKPGGPEEAADVADGFECGEVFLEDEAVAGGSG